MTCDPKSLEIRKLLTGNYEITKYYIIFLKLERVVSSFMLEILFSKLQGQSFAIPLQ